MREGLVNQTKKTIGIIGGMGPLATCDLYKKIIENTDAATDNEHIHLLIDSNNTIPDRTRAILSGGESPVPHLSASARRLQDMGADFLVMPCNIAHYFIGEVQSAVSIPLLDMVSETAAELQRIGIKKVGILATEGTLQAGIYDRELSRAGIDFVKPSERERRAIMGMIYDCVKAGDYRYDIAPFRAACERLLEDGAQALVLGCTELPIAFEVFALKYPHVDPTLILARAAVRYAGYRVRGEEPL